MSYLSTHLLTYEGATFEDFLSNFGANYEQLVNSASIMPLTWREGSFIYYYIVLPMWRILMQRVANEGRRVSKMMELTFM